MRKFFFTLPIFSALGILLFPVAYLALPEELFSGIVFYIGLLAALIIFFISLAIACLLLARQSSPSLEQAAIPLSLLTSSFISLSFSITFLIVFPVTLDRSTTTYLLETVRSKKSLSPSELEDIFIKDYVLNRQAIRRRIKEQEITGNIYIKHKESGKDSAVELSQQGHNFMLFADTVKQIFRLKDRNVENSANTGNLDASLKPD